MNPNQNKKSSGHTSQKAQAHDMVAAMTAVQQRKCCANASKMCVMVGAVQISEII